MKILRVCGSGLIVCCLLLCACSKSDIKKVLSKSDEKPTAETKAANTEPVELKVKWPVGNRYTERLQVNQTVDTTMGQAPKPISQVVKLEQEYALDVVKEREVDMEFLSIEMEVSMGGKVVANLDTKSEAGAAEANNPLAESFRQLVGVKLKYVLDASNRVQKIEGLKEFVDKATTASPRGAKAMVRSMFNEDYFKQLMEYEKWLPQKPVKPGDTWPVKTEIAAGPLGKIKTDLNYTFKNWEPHEKRNCAVLEFSGTLAPSKGATNQGPMFPTIESGTLSGKTWFDPEAGTAIESDMNQSLAMKSTYTVPAARNRTNAVGQAPAPVAPVTQTANMQMKQKINMKLVDFSGTGK